MKQKIHLTREDIAHNKKMYDEYHAQYKMVDGWHPGDKSANFYSLIRIAELTGIPLSGTTVLDVGCGTGDLSLFLRRLGIRDYLGIDIYPPSIRTAKEQYPDETFLLEDFLASPVRRKFDYAFCSGGMTINLPKIDNYAFLEETVRKMWKLSKVGLAFNVLTDDDDDPDPDLFFYNRKKVEDICKSIVGEQGTVVSEKSVGVYQVHFYVYRESAQIR